MEQESVPIRLPSKGKEEASSVADDINDLIARTSLASLGLGSPNREPARRKRMPDEAPPGCLVHDIQRTDTLAGVAMRYNTSVSELKKLNHMWSERDLFSRSTLIVPVKDDNSEELERQRSLKTQQFLQVVGAHSYAEEEARRFLAKYGWDVEQAVTAHHDNVKAERERLERSPPPKNLLNFSYSSAEEELGGPSGFYGNIDDGIASKRDEELRSDDVSFYEL